MDRRKLILLKILYTILCLAGLGWQFYEISNNYFQFFEVKTVKIQVPEEEKAKILNLCFDHLLIICNQLIVIIVEYSILICADFQIRQTFATQELYCEALVSVIQDHK